MEAGLKDKETYLVRGIELDLDGSHLKVDMNQPRNILVDAVDGLTGYSKTYILKVSKRGLCLV